MYTLKPNKCKIIFYILVILSIMNFVHFGCEQKHFIHRTQNEGGYGTDLKSLCPNKNWIKYTRYFGCGTYNLILAYIIWNY